MILRNSNFKWVHISLLRSKDCLYAWEKVLSRSTQGQGPAWTDLTFWVFASFFSSFISQRMKWIISDMVWGPSHLFVPGTKKVFKTHHSSSLLGILVRPFNLFLVHVILTKHTAGGVWLHSTKPIPPVLPPTHTHTHFRLGILSEIHKDKVKGVLFS